MNTPPNNIPTGLTLRHTLSGHKDVIVNVAFSPDGGVLASGSADRTLRLWNGQTGQLIRTLQGHMGSVFGVAFSPDGGVLASGSYDNTLRLWNGQTGQLIRTLQGHMGSVNSVAFSPDGEILVSGSADRTLRLWNVQTGQLIRTLQGHTRSVYSVAFSPDGGVLVSGSDDKTIGIWNGQTGQLIRTLKRYMGGVYSVAFSPDGGVLASSGYDGTIRLWEPSSGRRLGLLEGHTNSVRHISVSADGHLLASKSLDDTVRLWRTDTWEVIALLPEPASRYYWTSALAFHPHAPVLATLGEEDRVIRIWDLDDATLLGGADVPPVVHYTNAKVVLVGDSGVGKSGLGLVLTGKDFATTESTHGRRVWEFDRQEVALDERRYELRETLLWDLAGQPGYRLIHQLHLSDVAVALVVFDAHSETDPFAGVQHWDRALRLAQRLQGRTALPLKKFLVAARTDRGGVGVSAERMQAVVKELGFDGSFATSAKQGWQIAELRERIVQAIDWQRLPKVSSNALFHRLKQFLLAEKQRARRLISPIGDLYRTFLHTKEAPKETSELPAQFETCIGRVESAGLIKRLTFGDLILLQPELLDAYASALINAVKDEPDGLGSIPEDQVRSGHFRMPSSERIQDANQESLLLIAMIEDLLRRELSLREEGMLVFPSQSTKEHPDLPDPVGKAVVFTFEGPVLNLYATLAVRLSRSGVFKKQELWKNAVTYTTVLGGTCGMYLQNLGEGRGALTLFFDKAASHQTRRAFTDYIHQYLSLRALPESFKARYVLRCSTCYAVISDEIIQIRTARNLNWLNCPACDTRISLLEHISQSTTTPSSHTKQIDQAADTQRDREVAQSTLQGKIATQDFDVFLCHHEIDKPIVKQIGEQLKLRGILPWLDEWELRPGWPWQRLLEQQIGNIKAAAVFVGTSGIGPWQHHELDAFLREFVRRGCPVIPVLLADAPQEPFLPIFLKAMTWVDFRKTDPDPLERLIWGITGERGGR